MSKKRKNPYESAKRQKELERKRKKEQKKMNKINKTSDSDEMGQEEATDNLEAAETETNTEVEI
ncbi:MAG: hypothetical protein GY754_38125 [bacterium]|nr:hypothetical protein [bacterium]